MGSVWIGGGSTYGIVSVPERSKGVDSSSTVFALVGSNPTADSLLRLLKVPRIMLSCFHDSVTHGSDFLLGVADHAFARFFYPSFFLSRLIHLSRAHSISWLRSVYALNTFAARSRRVCCTL